MWTEQSKGKCTCGKPPDHEIARAAFQEELVIRLGSIRDAFMARSIGCAVVSDGPLMSELHLQESQAAEDHYLAERFDAIKEGEQPELEESNA